MSELPRRIKYDIFQEALFCNLAWSTNLALSVALIETEQYLCRVFSFFSTKNICKVLEILAQFPFTNERELDYFHRKVNIRVASQIAERLKT